MASTACRSCLVLLALISFLVSCRHANPPLDRTANASTQHAEAATCGWCPAEQRRIDALVTPELIFPVAEQRSLFDAHPPAMASDARIYGFELRTQPTMVAPRHFCLVSVTFTHASPTEDVPSSPALSSTAGPNGSFVDASARTADRAYRVRVSQAVLLPVSVRIPPFDPMKTLAELLRRYESTTARD